jgi:hypothetical protein
MDFRRITCALLFSTILATCPAHFILFNFIILIVLGEEDEMDRACSTNGEKRKAYRLLVGKPEGRRPLGKPRRR